MPYLGLVPPCDVQGCCEVTNASLHTWQKERSTGAMIAVEYTVRNLTCQALTACLSLEIDDRQDWRVSLLCVLYLSSFTPHFRDPPCSCVLMPI